MTMTTRLTRTLTVGLMMVPAVLTTTTVVEARPAAPAAPVAPARVSCIADEIESCTGTFDVSVTSPAGTDFSISWSLSTLSDQLETGTLTDEDPADLATTLLADSQSYIVDLVVPMHLNIDSLECTGGFNGSSLAPNHYTFTFDAVSSNGVDCVLAVSPLASLQINKTSNGGTGTFPFLLTEIGEDSGEVEVATTGSPNGTGSTTRYLDAGTYSIEEKANALWFRDSFTCTGPDGAIDPAEFEVVLGESYVCNAVNTLGVYFNITKTWKLPEDEQPESATFYWDGAADETFEVLTAEEYAGTIEPGEHTLTEVADGFDVSLHCDKFDIDGNYLTTYYGVGPAVDVDAVAGNRLFCFASNVPLAKVHITKVIDANLPEAPTFEFSAGSQSVDVVATMPSSPESTEGVLWVPGGEVVITENGPAGWELANVVCADSTDTDVPVTVAYAADTFVLDLAPGDEVWCSVYNMRAVSVTKTVTNFEPADTPGDYLVTWEVAAYNPFPGAFGSLTLTDEFDLPPGTEISGIAVVGTDLVSGWDGDSQTVLADGVGLNAEETKTWEINAVVSMDPNLSADLRECSTVPEDTVGGLGNLAILSFGDTNYSLDYVCVDLPAADLEVTKHPVGGSTDNGDGTWTQVYTVTVENVGNGYATYDLVDETDFAPIFEPESGWWYEGDDTPVVVEPWTGSVELAVGTPIGAQAVHTYTVGIVFTAPDLLELDGAADENGWFCVVDGDFVGQNGLLNHAILMLAPESFPDEFRKPISMETASACVDGPNPNILVDKEVVGYEYVGNDGITVDFDITVTNASSDKGGDAIEGGYFFIDPLLPFPGGVQGVTIELVGVDGATEGEDYESEIVEQGLWLMGLIAPDAEHVFHVRVTYVADVDEGFNGTCLDPTDFGELVGDDEETMVTAPGGAWNIVMWVDIFTVDGEVLPIFGPVGPGSSPQRRLDAVIVPPEGIGFPPGLGLAYDCLDLSAVFVDKEVVNDDGGEAQPDDFTFSLLQPDGDTERDVVPGEATLVVSGSYQLVEEADANYEAGSFLCKGSDFMEETLDSDQTERFGSRTAQSRVELVPATPGQVNLSLSPSWGWSCSIINDDKPADLSVDKSDADATAVAGGAPITYTFEVTNEVGFLTGDVTLRDELPDGWSWVAGSVTGCDTVEITGQELVCTIANSNLVDPESTVTVTAQARAAADAESGDSVNTVTVGSENDPAPEAALCASTARQDSHPNFDCEITPVVREATMTATKTSNASGPVSIGGTVVFTLTVTNQGPSTVLAGTTMVDDLPAGLNLISVSAPGWTCNAVDPLVCEYGSVLAVGETAPPVQVTTTVATGASGTITNTGLFTGIVDVEEALLDVDRVSRVEAVPVVVTATAVASAVAVIQVRSGGRIPETGADSLRWLPMASLLVGVGLFGLVLARRRRPTGTA